MKTPLSFLLLFLFLLGFGQTKEDSLFIKKIEKLKSNKHTKHFSKIEKSGFRGDYSMMATDTDRNKIPFYVEIHKKEVIHKYLIDNTEKDEIYLFDIKIYIKNWKKSEYIVLGERTELDYSNKILGKISLNDYNLDKKEIEKIITQQNKQ